MLFASEHQWTLYSSLLVITHTLQLHPNQPKHPPSFRRKTSVSKNLFMHTHGNGGLKTGQTLARSEKKQTANRSNFDQSTDALNGYVKPDQRRFSLKTCSIIMYFYLHSNSNAVSNGKYFLQKILGNLWMHFLCSCKALIFQDPGWSQAWHFKRQLD